jgi:hypothetical protein
MPQGLKLGHVIWNCILHTILYLVNETRVNNGHAHFLQVFSVTFRYCKQNSRVLMHQQLSSTFYLVTINATFGLFFGYNNIIMVMITIKPFQWCHKSMEWMTLITDHYWGSDILFSLTFLRHFAPKLRTVVL